MLTPYDLFRKDSTGNPIWIGTAEDISQAKTRLEIFASAKPGIYQIYDHRVAKFIETLAKSA